jgi:hypothetical protein
MAAISGKMASAMIGTTPICARNWSITDDKDLLDGTTVCSGGWKEYVEGLEGYTGSFMSYDFYVFSGAQDVSLSDASSNAEYTISGSAFVKTDYSGSVDGLNEYTYNLTFTGAVSVA